MKIIKPTVEILDDINQDAILKKLEFAGRVCYKSEAGIKQDSADGFIAAIIKRGHESVIEHFSFSAKFTVDRGVSHEIVRHRLASYSQESTRYCNYGKDGFGGEITVIEPSFLIYSTDGYDIWQKGCEQAEKAYFDLLNWGCKPEEARAVLPNSLKTEIIMTANLREWRHFIKLRTSPKAHPQIREVANKLLAMLRQSLPVIFDDLGDGR